MRYLATLLAAVLMAPALPAQDMPAALVETAPIQELEFHQELTLVGRTRARRESRIVAEVTGRVKSIAAEEGRKVKRGEALVTVDCRRVALALDAKKAEAAQAKADAELARKNLERARELVATSVFPQRNLDHAEADETRTTERFRELEAERRRLELDLEDCTIRAPFDGFTVRKLVDVGEWVEAGTPVYELVDLAVVKVTADLPERRFGQVQIGSRVTISRAGAEDAPLVGKVTGIAPRASQTTHTFPVIIEVDNADGRLGSGMLVRAKLALDNTFSSLAISKDAIIRRGERTLVYTAVDGLAAEVSVSIRASSGSLVAIAGDGLRAGMPVIVRGNERVEDGSPVRVDGDHER
ncbi:MAG: efflux RND transporter periplasmic adaptor subunit [Thermoanaerobaculia bacterium]